MAVGSLPRFIVMSLGEDHTTGTTPGTFTPQACVASNDLALGRLVEVVSRSKSWPQTVIFVIEDDAQNGPDHADAHRTVGLEKACEIALSHGAYRLRTLRQLLKRSAPRQEPLPFLDEHPIIRPLDDYAQLVARAIHRQQDHAAHGARPSVGEGFTRHGSGVRGASSSPGSADHQGCGTCSTRPRSDYPLPGCSPAEHGSGSPDSSSVVKRSPFHQELQK